MKGEKDLPQKYVGIVTDVKAAKTDPSLTVITHSQAKFCKALVEEFWGLDQGGDTTAARARVKPKDTPVSTTYAQNGNKGDFEEGALKDKCL